MTLPRPSQAKAPLIATAVIAAYALAAYASLEFLKGPNGRAALFLSNAFLLSGLLLLRGRWRIICLFGCIAACAIVVRLRGLALDYALGAGLIAGVSCLTGAWLGRRVLPQPSLKNLRQALMILLLVIAPSSLVSGFLSAGWIHLRTGRPMFPEATEWFFASLVGTSMILPTLLALATPPTTPPPRREWIETAGLGFIVLAVLAAPWFGLYYLSLMLAFPLANLLAMRIGARGTALTLTVINLSAFAFPFLARDSLLHQLTPEFGSTVILGLQVYSMIVFYNGLLTALAINQQVRTKRQLERRTAMARSARAEAMKASQAKTEFLATMSHEVRTPLNSILGFSQLMERRADLSGEARRQLGMIQRSGESLLSLVDDLLDFAKVEAGKLTLDPRPGSLRAVAEEAMAIVSPAAAAKNLAIAVIGAEAIEGRHLFDDHRLRQILLNFLNNAVKFTDAGGVELRLAVESAEADRDRVRFEVRDTGVGISAEALPRLFQRFTQADSSISRSYGGTGLGLSISKGLAELMGGRVGVDSREGQGSTFWVELTLARAPDSQTQDAPGAGESEIAAHILLVDDNAANRELGVSILTLLGCSVETASDGAEAIEAAGRERFDLILMDVHMPGIDGLAATRAIRKSGGTSAATPIIAMTADVLPEQIERCQAAGMVDHVAKPINVQRLYERLAYWLTARDPASADEAA